MTYYEVLEVSENASEEVIKMAYKALCRKYHPDVYNGDEKFANDMMSLINEAYGVLSDPEKRSSYDYFLQAQREPRQAQEEKRQDDYYEPEESNDYKMPGFEWFKIYRFLVLLLGIKEIFSTFINIFTEDTIEFIQDYPTISILALSFDFVVAILCFYTGYGMFKIKRKAYHTNILLLIIYPFLVGFSNIADENAFAILIAASIFSAINIYYFQRRKFIFGACGLHEFSFKKCVIPLCMMIAMSASIFFVPMLFENTESKDYTEISYTSSEDITRNFNKLAQHYGYKDWIEMVEYLNNEYNDDLSTSLSNWITYERIATEYLGLDSYDDAKGKIDPYLNEEIKTFGDYQTYVYRCAIESE